MIVLVACLLAHALIAQTVSSPWWVPDLTLVGLVLAVGIRPARWLAASLVAALFSFLWAIRFSGQLFTGSLLCGWLASRVGTRWDATDVRVQALVALLACALMTFGMMWLENLWSLPLLSVALIHVAITGLCVPTVRRLLISAARMPM